MRHPSPRGAIAPWGVGGVTVSGVHRPYRIDRARGMGTPARTRSSSLEALGDDPRSNWCRIAPCPPPPCVALAWQFWPMVAVVPSAA